MRPQRLHIEGFASFREPCDIDFTDAELFVITGPTGSGKSSLIDAMVFALYGSVPRYDDSRMLFPVITTGKSEARVQFDFAVGAEEYTAARVVRRTKTGGATTKEARLERRRKNGDPETLAGDADGVTTGVEALLGLGFGHFQKCVALPQGAFAEFLRAKPTERQDLLVKLLDMDLYRNMAKQANSLAKDHEARAEYIEAELSGDLAAATPEVLKARKKRGKELEGLGKRIESTEPKLELLRRKVEEAAKSRDEARKRATDLSRVQPPKDIADLAQLGQQVRQLLETARTAKQAADADLYKEQAALEALPNVADLKLLLQAYLQKAEVETQVSELEKQVKIARKVAADDETARGKAEQTRRAAETVLEKARTAHAAADLAAGLGTGDTCPVCAQTIAKMPKHATPRELQAAQTAQRQADADLATATQKRDRSAQEASSLEGKLQGAKDRLAAAGKSVEGKPSPEELHKQLAEAEAAAETVKKVQNASRTAGKQLESAEDARTKLDKALKEAWRTLDAARDGVSALEPPAVEDRDDLAGAWTALTGWARDMEPKERKRAETLDEAAGEQQEALDEELKELLAQCNVLGVQVTERNYATRVAAELATVEAGIQVVLEAIEKSKALREQQKQLRVQAKVEKELSRLLGTTGFEAWLLQRALERLCSSASHLLRDLSSNQYSIQINEKRDFEVIDHSNADEPRLARTLSGGETFMASLSLALALAEDVAQLAAGGAARLDSLFLDEGFGTLDSETLDTVATAIEALGARGRVVGLITHVRELAERMPVRFQVTKDSRTSSVERVSA